jgi:CHASE2 domain-containing sensor protein
MQDDQQQLGRSGAGVFVSSSACGIQSISVCTLLRHPCQLAVLLLVAAATITGWLSYGTLSAAASLGHVSSMATASVRFMQIGQHS